MKKHFLIIGPTSSGKTTLAHLLTKNLQESTVVWLNGKQAEEAINKGQYGVNARCEAIVIDELDDMRELQFYKKPIEDGIRISHDEHKGFTIKPIFFIICSDWIKASRDKSLTKYFNIIDHSKPIDFGGVLRDAIEVIIMYTPQYKTNRTAPQKVATIIDDFVFDPDNTLVNKILDDLKAKEQ